MHLQHLTKLQLLGKLVLNGPTLIEHEILGVSVYAADLEEAQALAEADPKVKEGYLTIEAIPWVAVPSPERGGRVRCRSSVGSGAWLSGCSGPSVHLRRARALASPFGHLSPLQ